MTFFVFALFLSYGIIYNYKEGILMEERLAQLIYDYSKHKSKVDKEFINKFLEIIKSDLQLEEYILKSRITHNRKYLAAYNFMGRSLNTNINLIYKNSDYLVKTEYPNLNLSRMDKYIVFMQVLLHEVEHAKQKRQIDENHCDIESLILREEYKPLNEIWAKLENNQATLKDSKKFTENMKLRKQYYYYSPSERLAESKSSKLTSDIALILDAEISSELMLYNYWNILLSGYNVGLIDDLSDEPTRFYLSHINPSYEWEQIQNLSKNLDNDSLVSLGLKVSNNELHSIAEKAYKIGSRIRKL